MSSIVSFYTLSATKLEQLIISSKIKIVESHSGILFFKKTLTKQVDDFWSFLKTNATSLKEFEYSGNSFLTLHDILAERKVDFYDFELSEASAVFRENRSDSSFIISADSASQLLEKLKTIKISSEEIATNYLSFYEEPIPEGGVEAVANAFMIFKVWLSSVETNQIGIFLFG
jgi:hypothetical protein